MRSVFERRNDTPLYGGFPYFFPPQITRLTFLKDLGCLTILRLESNHSPRVDNELSREMGLIVDLGLMRKIAHDKLYINKTEKQVRWRKRCCKGF